ncbi:MAG: hypothetical protein SGI97_02395 [candidate division Zixibacteria bacterium]|nr:hypothetical protein [candidate division Zixibacteria bacterium]
MTEDNKNPSKPSFLKSIKQNTSALATIGVCFVTGMGLQWKIDSGLIAEDGRHIAQLETERDFYKNRTADAMNVEDFFAKFDIAQMSPEGDYRLLFGTSSMGSISSEITGLIDSAISALQNGEEPKAITQLNRVIKILPEFPYSYYYLGIAELSTNIQKRAEHQFVRAHELFTILLRIRPNNASMRLFDAMSLTYLGHGDSATSQLYKTKKGSPYWEIGCLRQHLQYDSTALSKEERVTWVQFFDALNGLKCDTTMISSSVVAVDVRAPLPVIKWPQVYE